MAHLVEGVGEGEVGDVAAVPVCGKLWLDVEEDGHVHCLPSLQPLLLKAEALDLVEVLGHLVGGHVVQRVASHGLGTGGRGGGDSRGLGTCGGGHSLALDS